MASDPDGAGLRSFFTFFFNEVRSGADLQPGEPLIQYAILVKIYLSSARRF